MADDPLPPLPNDVVKCDADDNSAPFNDDEFILDDLDFDLSFNDIFPPVDDDSLLNPTSYEPGQIDPSAFSQQLIGSDSSLIFKSSSPELRHVSGDRAHSGGTHQSSSGSHVLSALSPGDRTADVSTYLNVPSPESNASNHESGNDNKEVDHSRVLNFPSPVSQDSGNCGSNFSEALDFSKSVTSSPNNVVVEQNSNSNDSKKLSSVLNNVVVEQNSNSNNSKKLNSVLKRKKVSEEDSNNVSKYHKSDYVVESSNVVSSEDEKRKARLIRNRESAQLSRQRKKHYVEELEDKVRTMHSTIQDLNAKISYIMSENATLRSQMGGSGIPPPPPGMYPHPPMMYPWMPCASPYMVKPQGSQVPLVPIPRLKPQAPASAPKSSKKVENKKTKKVASISFLGLLFFMLLFGGLVPVVNMRYGGVKKPFTSGDFYNERHHGRVLAVDGQVNGSSYSGKHKGKDCGTHCGRRGQGGDAQPNFNSSADELIHSGNGSEPLMASLYVPRNDKLVKIDGNLIIHSILASEKAMTSGETGLAVPGDLAPVIPGRHPHHYRSSADGKRALGSGDKEKAKSTMQQWFLEGVAGPMLSSGMCTEVFQFNVSSAVVPSNAFRNISMEQRQNVTINKGRNRRILNDLPVPVPGVYHNISEEHAGGRTGKKDEFSGNSSLSSMVVSVLVDPREAGDADVDGMMGPKSISRIFVVVLVDSVKYVTYSCMLPFKGSVPLVTT